MEKTDLIKLKSKIDKKKEKHLTERGELELLNKQMKETWDCDTVGEAEKIIDKLQTDLDTVNAKIKKGTKNLKKLLDET